MLVPGFPPMPRPFKLCKHLPAFGWRGVMLAPRDPSRGDTRFTSADQLSGLDVSLTPTLPSLSRWIRLRRKREPKAASQTSEVSGGSAALPSWERFVRLFVMWLSTPDEDISWVPHAVWRGYRLSRARPIRALYATGPPFSVVLAGALLKGLTGLPLVSDFRDSWTLDGSDPLGVVGGPFRAGHGPSRVKALERLERACLRRSDCVLFTSHFTRDAYARRYPGLARRMQLVFNGVEEEDFAVAPRQFSRSTIAYVGTLHPFQFEQVALLLRAFAKARVAHPETEAAGLFIAGHRPPQFDRQLSDLAENLAIRDHLTLSEPVRHCESVAITKGADLLLLFDGGSPFIRVSKISDYAAVGTPILGLAVDGGETARHLRELGHTVYSGSSPDELARLLGEVWRGRRSRDATAGFPFPFPHPLNWKTAAQQLAHQLDSLAGVELAAPETLEVP